MSTLKTNQLTHLSNTGTANVVMAQDGSLTLADDVTIRDNLTVDNNATITGTATLASTLGVTGNTTVNGQLSVTGNSVSFSGVTQIGMSSSSSAYNIGTNGEGNRTVTTSSSTPTGGNDGDIVYVVS